MRVPSNRRESTVSSSWTGRLICVAVALIVLAGAGVGYYFMITRTAFAFRCIFHEVTGWLCPGCGVTRMCLALIRFDFAGALAANPALMALSPVLGLCLARTTVGYVRTGSMKPPRWVERILWVCVAILLIFGVVRNVLQ